MDNTSSMYLYVKLNWDVFTRFFTSNNPVFILDYANSFLPVESKDCMNSASYEYRNILGEKHSLCPCECRLSLGKTFLRRPRTCCQLETRSSWCLLQWTCSSNQSVPLQNSPPPSRPKTKHLYLRFPFLWMKFMNQKPITLGCKHNKLWDTIGNIFRYSSEVWSDFNDLIQSWTIT